MFLLWFLCGYFLSVTSLFSAHITGSFTIKVSLRQLYYLPRLCFCCVVFANGYSKMCFNHCPTVETNHGLYFHIWPLWPGKTIVPVTVTLSSVCKHLQHCLSRRWWCKVQNLSTPVLCAQRLMTIGCFISRRHWHAVTQAWNTLMENTSLNMPTKAKIKSINCHATATHLEVQAEPNGKKKGLVERLLVLCRLKATDVQPSRGFKGKLFK